MLFSFAPPCRRLTSGLVLAACAGALWAQPQWPVPEDLDQNGVIDSQEIQRVIDATDSDTVFLPAKNTYRLTSPVMLARDHVQILGEGHGSSSQGGTILQLRGDTPAFIVEKCRGAAIRFCHVIGDREFHRSPGIIVRSAEKTALEDLRITGTGCGISVTSSHETRIVDVALRGIAGSWGFFIEGSAAAPTTHTELARLSAAGAAGNTNVDWLVVSGLVDGLAIRSTRFIGGRRGLHFFGNPAPRNARIWRFGSDNAVGDAVHLEGGQNITMINSWIGQPDGHGFIVGAEVDGLVLTNPRIRGAGGHGLKIEGGRNIAVNNPLIGANGRAFPPGSMIGAGIAISEHARHVIVQGGRVGPLYNQGKGAKQYFSIDYAGTKADAKRNTILIVNVNTADNPIRLAP